MILTSLLCIVFGYLAGYLFRSVITCMHAPMGKNNLRHTGITWRRGLAFILLIIGAVFDIPLVLFFAGFTLYQSERKWCIIKSLHVKDTKE